MSNRQAVLTLLNKYFKTTVVEKYPEVMINTYADRAWDAVCGPDFNKQRISEKTRVKLRDHILRELRVNYGKWISIINFDKKLKFATNFEFVYKTEFGRLYANPPKSGFEHLFFTSHSLKQFDERVPLDKLNDFRLVYKKSFGIDPTAADILLFFVILCFQFGVKDKFIFINVNYGILVVEVLGDACFIVKTFLSPDMVTPDISWYNLKPEFNSISTKLGTFIKDVNSVADPVDEPTFEYSGFDYEFFNNILNKK